MYSSIIGYNGGILLYCLACSTVCDIYLYQSVRHYLNRVHICIVHWSPAHYLNSVCYY